MKKFNVVIGGIIFSLIACGSHPITSGVVSEEKFNSSFEFCQEALRKSGVVLVPGTAFGDCGEGFFRLSYVCSDEQLQEVIDRFKADGFYFS